MRSWLASPSSSSSSYASSSSTQRTVSRRSSHWPPSFLASPLCSETQRRRCSSRSVLDHLCPPRALLTCRSVRPRQLIFIFSTHVYDVGDLIIIDDQVLTVKEFGLFATTFRRADGQEVVAPNSLLATTKLIQNMRRSGSQSVHSNICYVLGH